jgi:hypothetical protein
MIVPTVRARKETEMRWTVYVQGCVYGVFTSVQAADIWAKANIKDGSPWSICQYIRIDD